MIHHGNCVKVMADMPEASVDAIVCDPPYDLTAGKKGGTGAASLNLNSPAGRSRISTGGGFMGKEWDATGVAFDPDTWRAALRVLKPGGHLLAFGGTRTWHRLAVAIEDAGFELRDSIMWMYGSGFPKSLDVGKAIDKAAGAEREIVGTKLGQPGYSIASGGEVAWGGLRQNPADECAVTTPATPEAAKWNGWGTALKPAHEPIIVARKPLDGTVAANVLAHGTGALNIDATRIGYQSDSDRASARPQGQATALNGALAGKAQTCQSSTTTTDPSTTALTMDSSATSSTGSVPNAAGLHRKAFSPNQSDLGRWPANVILDSDQAAALDAQSGNQKDGVAVQRNRKGVKPANVYGKFNSTNDDQGYGGQGGASRFFATFPSPLVTTVANAISANPCDRDGDGHKAEECPQAHAVLNALASNDARFRYCAKAPKNERPVVDGVAHPTVKPLSLMRWLVRLVTPPGGVVLDPFAGSGTTIEACILEGFAAVGIEQDAAYLPLIQERIRRCQERPHEPDEPTLFGEAS